MNKKRKGRSWPVIFLCCLLAVPTMEALLGRYGAAPTLELARPALTVGALLGVAHILLRPLLLPSSRAPAKDLPVFIPYGILRFAQNDM